MSSKQSSPDNAIRPTKKQRDLLDFIEKFIGQHGYSPSYREIMNGLEYTSVATVALHVNSLITRGHLRKRDRSARSLEVVRDGTDGANRQQSAAQAGAKTESQAGAGTSPEDWLLSKIAERFAQAEQAPAKKGTGHAEDGDAATSATGELQQLDALVVTLGVLGMEAQADAYAARLEILAGNAGSAIPTR